MSDEETPHDWRWVESGGGDDLWRCLVCGTHVRIHISAAWRPEAHLSSRGVMYDCIEQQMKMVLES